MAWDAVYITEDNARLMIHASRCGDFRVEIQCREADIGIPTSDDLITVEVGGIALVGKLAEPPRPVSPGIVTLVLSVPSLLGS